jgi:hypothetical protein
MVASMSKSVGSRTLWFAGSIVAAGVTLTAQSGSAPAGAVRQKAFPVGVLAELQGVLREGVPVALVLGPTDKMDGPPPSASSSLPPAAGAGGPPVLEAFRRRWSQAFTITQSNNVVTVTSPRNRLCKAGLPRTVPAQTFSGAPYQILFAIASTFDESLRTLPSPSMVHGGGTGMTDESRESLRRPITIRVEQGTLQQALDRLITSVHGLGWLASERCDANGTCGCYLSLMTESSVVWTSYDAAAGLQAAARDRVR